MIYHFQDFAFNSKDLVLLKQGEIVKLRINEAKILALLLNDPESILSKRDIFENVWSGEVITEQPIFQNISRLRAIFGSEAIVNHPKKGYQWKIPLTPAATVTAELPTVQIKNKPHRAGYYVAAIALVSIFLSVFFLKQSVKEEKTPASTYKFALMSVNSQIAEFSQAQVTDKFQQALSHHGNDVDIVIDEKLTYRELDANLEYILWDRLNQYQADGLILLNISSKYNKLYLDLEVVGKSYHWDSELLADNMPELLQQFTQQLSYINSAQLFEKPKISDKYIHAKLQLLHQQHFKDVSVLSKIVMMEEDLSHALLLAQQLETLAVKQGNLVYQAYAYKLQGEIYTRKSHFERAQQSLDAAVDIYRQYGDIDNQIAISDALTILAYFEHDYEKVRGLVIETINLAKQIGDYKNEFWQNLYLSKIAAIFQQKNDKTDYFTRAESVYHSRFFEPAAEVKYQFYAQVLARFYNDKAKLIDNLLKMLATANQYQGLPSYYKTGPQAELTQLYLEERRFEEALALFDLTATLTSVEKSLLAKIYIHSGEMILALDYAKQAYQESVLAGELQTSLDSAVLLIEMSEDEKIKTLIHKALYLDYIKDNASPDWIANNQELFKKLDFKTSQQE